MQEHRVAEREVEHALTDTDARGAPQHDVELGLLVKVSGPSELGLMLPQLRSTPGQHRKRLIQRRVHGAPFDQATPRSRAAGARNEMFAWFGSGTKFR